MSDAIEAGARAVAKLAGDNWDRLDVQWNDDKAELVRAAYRRRARMVLEAAAPLIEAAVRAKVAEEIAEAIEAEVRSAKKEDGVYVSDHTRGIQYAANLVRQHARSVA